ncbi:MAG: DUF1501 domain-containing protein [Saprospiraceae bacterium]|nr:DUF1501 domain-containing protein [Saprospiraceae bacterium]MBK8449750.1 DUF1501 domain-containing protein [Saprospiraceae bacterium]MBK8484180.1 DUF1501 domain-containing protein [Saprospiraceae bacterium]MBK9728543.1 DUF1501 domain-containing protein [Saprospiraceae bacterium]
MCNDHNLNNNLFRSDLGEKHTEDHLLWNRRQFLLTGGIAGLGSMLLSGIPVNPLFSKAFASPLVQGGDNILVLVKMFGGNDGLNMVFPHSDAAGKAEYINYRPSLSQKFGTDYNSNTVLSGFGSDDFALPGTMASLMSLWNSGNMNILHNVGYPNQDYSHFTSIDNWASAADNSLDPRSKSGYMGRYLEQDFPVFNETPPTVPPALRIGYNADLVFKSASNQQFELVFNDPNEFYRLAQFGKLYPTDGLGDCPQGQEVEFLRQLTNNSLRYSQSVTQAYNSTINKVAYPANTTSRIAEQLKIVSRLIKGKLGTRVYMVYMDGYDTHADQKNYHNGLLGNLADSISSFFADLQADNADKNVCMMTFSEFGRTIRENGSVGTDHGNMSPIMLFGDAVKGGFTGTPMNLNDATLKAGDARVYFEKQTSLDFRHMYSTVMEQWLCLDTELVNYSLGENYSRLSLFDNPCTGSSSGSNYNTILLGHNPNEFNSKIVDLKFSQLHSNEVKLVVKSVNGKTLAVLHEGYTVKGSYTIPFDPQKWKIQPGEYIYQLDSAGKTFMRRFNIF